MSSTSFRRFHCLASLQLFPELFPVKFVAITPGEEGSDGDLDLCGSNSSGKVRCSHICQVDSADAKITGKKKPPY